MFGLGKKRREQEEAEMRRLAALAASEEKKRKEMEALAANPEIAAKAAQARAVVAAEVAEDLRRTQITAEQQRQFRSKLISWARSNQKEVDQIVDAITLQVFGVAGSTDPSDIKGFLYRNLCADVVTSILDPTHKMGFTAKDNAARSEMENIKHEFFHKAREHMEGTNIE